MSVVLQARRLRYKVPALHGACATGHLRHVSFLG